MINLNLVVALTVFLGCQILSNSFNTSRSSEEVLPRAHECNVPESPPDPTLMATTMDHPSNMLFNAPIYIPDHGTEHSSRSILKATGIAKANHSVNFEENSGNKSSGHAMRYYASDSNTQPRAIINKGKVRMRIQSGSSDSEDSRPDKGVGKPRNW